MGRRSTKIKGYLLESQKLKSFASFDSSRTPPWLGLNWIQPGRVVRSGDALPVHCL